MAEARLPVAVVTGANRGIGKAIVEGLAATGRHVVLVCRRPDDGEAAARDIRGRHPQASLEVAPADLSSLSSVRELASRLLARHPRIAILVNNAAVALKQRQESVDGIEMTLAVNHLAPFALTLLLLPALRGGGEAPSRVVTVSSGSQHGQKIVLDDLQNRRRRYGGVRAYGETKLMNVLFTRELARRGRPLGVAAFCLHPGVIGTNLLLDYLPLQPLLRPLFARFTGTPTKGADTAVWLATAPGLEDQVGGFFVRRKPARPNALANDARLAAGLWEASERLTGASWPA
jgi:NAD(P)-dependent dehydrogenase (short-subunit alcohol dehydrogenase family)